MQSLQISFFGLTSLFVLFLPLSTPSLDIDYRVPANYEVEEFPDAEVRKKDAKEEQRERPNHRVQVGVQPAARDLFWPKGDAPADPTNADLNYPSFCQESGTCQYVTSRVKRATRQKREAVLTHNCEIEVPIEASTGRFTLCLHQKHFREHMLFANSYDKINVSIFSEGNSTEDMPLGDLDLHYATGVVKEEVFSSVTGYILDDHFYGMIYIKDTVHYLEPLGKPSRDLHIFGDGLKTLLHTNDIIGENGAVTLGKKPIENNGNPERRLCDLTVVADHLFYNDVGMGDIHHTILQMLWHIKEANALLMSKDFDVDGQSECLGFTVSEITIFKSDKSDVNLLTGNFDIPEDFLKKFSRYNFDGFCLGILFTNRAFNELVLGLSWRGNPKEDGVGGICQNRVRIKSDKNAYSFNALFISLKSSQEERIPLKMGILNLLHEMMHSFGAKHDPDTEEDPECTPKDKWPNGRFLMSKYSNDGHKLNHEILSPCTKDLVLKNLAAPNRVACLRRDHDSFCGDGIIQDGEECDCGTIFQCVAARSCCVPPEGRLDKKPCTLQVDKMSNCVR